MTAPAGEDQVVIRVCATVHADGPWVCITLGDASILLGPQEALRFGGLCGRAAALAIQSAKAIAGDPEALALFNTEPAGLA